MALEPGSLLHGRYRIQETIAAGGMGAVYQARDESLGILVAVKENFFTTDEFSRQFRREATILASLRHPNLPRVTDHFVVPGQGQYLVMDFIAGTDLRELINTKGSLADEEVVRLGAAICDALTYLHTRIPPIVHRDIKPGNLKINPAGVVYLVDFGLAKVAHGEATTTGAQGLTPGYAPPEQYGQGTEPRSDIYSLGATLYAALTGKIPEDGLSRAMGTAELTPIRRHNPQITDNTARAIERAMAVRASDRYEDAEAFKKALLQGMPAARMAPGSTSSRPAAVTALEPIPSLVTVQKPRAPAQEPAKSPGENQPVPPPPEAKAGKAPARKSFALSPVMGVGLVILALAGAGLFWFKSLPALPSSTAPTLTPVSTASSAPAPTEAPAPTQTQPPAPASTLTTAPTATIPAATKTPVPTATESVPTPTATPAGGGLGQIAFASDRSGSVQVWLMNADGTDPKQVTSLADGACQPDWSPDGKQLVFTSPCPGKKDIYPGSSLFLINPDGTGLVPLSSLPGGDFDPAWSPDGRYIAFTSLRDGLAHIYLYDLTDGTARLLSKSVNHERRPTWSPDGEMIAYETTRLGQPQIWVMKLKDESASEFSNLSFGAVYMPDWSRDGKTMIYSQGANQPPLVARQTGDKLAKEFFVSDRIRPVEEARFSPDSWWIAFTSRANNNTDIYCMQRNGSELQQLTDSPGLDFHPAWRPVKK